MQAIHVHQIVWKKPNKDSIVQECDANEVE